jgi:hypothetical protein
LNARFFLSLFGVIPVITIIIIIIITITTIIIVTVIIVVALGWRRQQLQGEIWRRIASPAPVSTERTPEPVSITNIAAPLSARLPVFGLPALIPFYTDELSIC